MIPLSLQKLSRTTTTTVFFHLFFWIFLIWFFLPTVEGSSRTRYKKRLPIECNSSLSSSSSFSSSSFSSSSFSSSSSRVASGLHKLRPLALKRAQATSFAMRGRSSGDGGGGWSTNQLATMLADRFADSCDSFTDQDFIDECCDEGCYFEEVAEMIRACGTKWMQRTMCRVSVL